ncbi:MAG: nuclear transport factor 2 family protein [Halothiobacillus sp.]
MFAGDWIAAGNHHDLERILAHDADDFTMRAPMIITLAGEPSGQLRGKSAGGDYGRHALAPIPASHCERLTTVIGINSIVLHYHGAGGGLAAETFEFNQHRLMCAASAHCCG